MFAVFGAADPHIIYCYHYVPPKALPWPKTRRLCYHALQLVSWLGLWTRGRNKNRYINLYKYLDIKIFLNK